MALLKYYNSKIHDLYLYDRLATTTQSSIPVGYNPDCQSYGIADFSGCCARNRHFCTLIGITYGVQFDRENVNFWNCCAYRGVLISPKHMIICEHFRGPRPGPNDNTSGIVLLGKSGTRHTVKVVAVTLSIGSDQTLLEFDQPVPEGEFYIYNKIADPAYVPNGTHIWVQDSNGKIYKRIFKKAIFVDGKLTSWQSDPCIDGINDGPHTSGDPAIFVGDSGSPAFVVNSEGETLLLGLMYGGPNFPQKTIDNINAKLNPHGYSVSLEKMTALPQDLNQDGKIDSVDLSIFMSNWEVNGEIADFNKDGKVDAEDMSELLSKWGSYDLSSSAVHYTTTVTPIDPNNTKRI
jgi:hypothetical protein